MKSAITVVYSDFIREEDIHTDACKVVGFDHRYECKTVPRVLSDGTKVEDLIPTHRIYNHQVQILKTYGEGQYTISCKITEDGRTRETIRTYKNNKMPVEFVAKKTRKNGEEVITDTVTYTSHNSFVYVTKDSYSTEEQTVSCGMIQKVVETFANGKPPRILERKDGELRETSERPERKNPIRVFLLNTGGAQ
ncbi:hypothetical protein ISTM_379 [Insectomime virus]|uniref:Uncharacterized protein n=1 Tax=Tunisvirus fontaine2 TaxID=1421067 RepID=V9SE10_9VIRU|nr:hypothetical protein D1R32_gp421 [Tunisvirus fontaine2]AHA46277.1 hypothetical protein ISTM_379 [Insectomime virus]AHC55138.1 hypothetical protein TNS_ORF420 [Tunisvirus fontaine2]